MSLAAFHHDLLTHRPPPPMPPTPADREADAWTARMPAAAVPIMRSFPRLAVERDEEALVESTFDEEPERWDGMA
jgi:hypothetical protein